MANEEVTREEIEAGARTIQELWPAPLSAEFAKDMAYNILLAASQSRPTKGADGVEGELTKRAAWLLDGTKKLRFFRGRMYDDDADKYLVELHKFLAEVMSLQFPASGWGMVAEEQIADAIQKSIEKGCDITPAESLIAARAVMVLFAPSPDNGWLPIESAPRDGSLCLVFNSLGNVHIARWGVRYVGDPGHEAWVYEGKYIGGNVTHWHLLPPPPAQTEDKP